MLELTRAVAAEHDVGVAIDQAGRDQSPVKVVRLGRRYSAGSSRAGPTQAILSSFDRHGPALRSGRKPIPGAMRGERGVGEQHHCRLACIDPACMSFMYIHNNLSSGIDACNRSGRRQALLPEGWQPGCHGHPRRGGAHRTRGRRTRQPPGTGSGFCSPPRSTCIRHAFQRAMAGLTERRGPDPQDSFWTWRTADVPVPRPPHAGTRRGDRRLRADGDAGGRLRRECRVPLPAPPPRRRALRRPGRDVGADRRRGGHLRHRSDACCRCYYQFGGCDGRALGPGQVRFGNDPRPVLAAVGGRAGALASTCRGDAGIGVAPHSLARRQRSGTWPAGVTAPDRRRSTCTWPSRWPRSRRCEAAWGARPVELAYAAHDIVDRAGA